MRTTVSLPEKPAGRVPAYTLGISWSSKNKLVCKPDAVEVHTVLDVTEDDVLDLNDAIKAMFGL